MRGRHEAQAVLSLIVAAVIDELDLTAIVRDRLPAEAIEAVIARIDLVGLANEVIDAVDLPAIIRESTSSVTAEVMTDVRTQGERADEKRNQGHQERAEAGGQQYGSGGAPVGSGTPVRGNSS